MFTGACVREQSRQGAKARRRSHRLAPQAMVAFAGQSSGAGQGGVSGRAGLAHRHHSRRLCDAALRHRQPRRPLVGAARAGAHATLHLRAQPRHLLHVLDLLRLGRPRHRARAGIPRHLYRPGAGLRLRLPAAETHHRARQGRKDHLDRRLPRRALRQEFRRRLDRHADRRRRRGSLYRAAAQGDLRLGQPDGRALQRRAADLRPLRQRHLADHRHAACAVRRAVRHAPRRRDRASGRAGAGGRGRVRRQARGLPRGRRVRLLLPVRQSRRACSTRSPPTARCRRRSTTARRSAPGW